MGLDRSVKGVAETRVRPIVANAPLFRLLLTIFSICTGTHAPDVSEPCVNQRDAMAVWYLGLTGAEQG
ncbi:hypothetical protein Skr01_41600 [Sphaerisporangium krabiense]|uniref:Uncharacterized protein n=1 Tax=Sphaerisporangium krabiense TaxID=763782 RepID=A0A7W8Z0X2_9ACTN|nr:hypothetical protein [Sphaerisporangium krabiense]GII64075.1 hypothetical protein Skr01_41600 [Sphaerisporangium krabiense]